MTPAFAGCVSRAVRRRNVAALATIARAAAGALLVAWLAATASAQELGQPYRGLFGDVPLAASRPDPAPRVTLSIDAYGLSEWDRSTSVDGDDSHGGFELRASRRHAGRRLTVDVRGGSQLRRYRDGRAFDWDQQWAGVSLRLRTSRLTTFGATSRATYSPVYQLRVPDASQAFGPDRNEGPLSGPAFDVNTMRNATFAAAFTASHRMGRTVSVESGYDLTRVAFLDRGTAMTAQRASARWSRRASHGPAMHLRYEYGHVSSEPTEGPLETITHQFDLGVVHTPTRLPDTTIAFSVTPTVMLRRQELSGAPYALASTDNGVRLGASASITHRLRRGWLASGAYQRAVYSDEGYVQPVFLQTVSGRVEGRLTRSLHLRASASYSTGVPNGALSRPATGGFGYALRCGYVVTPATALFVEYQRAATTRPGDVQGEAGGTIDRETLRFGISLSGHAR